VIKALTSPGWHKAIRESRGKKHQLKEEKENGKEAVVK